MRDQITIGVNALYLIPGGVGGTEIYLRSLLQGLAEIDPINRYLIYTNRETGSDILPLGASNFVAVVQPVSAVRRSVRILWEQSGLVGVLKRDRVDVVFNPGVTAPLMARCPSVTVFHDMQHKRHPEFARRRDLPFFRLLFWLAASASSRLIAVSDATKKDMLHYYRLPPRKIRAIPHGVDSKFFEIGARRAQQTPKKFILSVSTLHPHKNFDALLRAFAAFRQEHHDFQLIISGLEGFAANTLKQLAKNLGLSDSVIFTGWIPRNDLYKLFETASAFIYPSKFEGFGMPMLEALASGLPSACSDIEPLNRIVRDAALLFDPDDESALLAALNKLVHDKAIQDRLLTAGPARAARFSWHRTARATLRVLQAAVRNPSPDWEDSSPRQVFSQRREQILSKSG